MGARPNERATESLQTVALPPIDSNQRYSTDEAAAYLRISRAWLYKHIASGHIRTVMDGRRRYVPGSEIVARSRVA